MRVVLKERILTEPIILKQRDVVLVERELDPAIVLQQKTVTLMERILTDSVKLAGHDFEILCPTPFVFSNVLPSLVVVPFDRTYLRARWNADFDKTEMRIAFKKGLDAWQYTAWNLGSPTATSFQLTMITVLDTRAHKGVYVWYVSNKDAYGNEEDSSQHSFRLSYNVFLRAWELVIIS